MNGLILAKRRTCLSIHTYKKLSPAINSIYPFEDINTEMILKQAGGAFSKLGSGALNVSAKLVGNVTQVVTTFVLMLFVLFFLLRDHEFLVEKMRHVIPLSRSQEDKLLNEIENVAKSAMLGSFITALVQGIAGRFCHVAGWFSRFILGHDDGLLLIHPHGGYRVNMASCSYLFVTY